MVNFLKKTLFIKNALILTATSLFLRFAGIIFKVWLAAEIGSEGVGLYQLIFSVYVLASTFATSGISTAVTRLITEEIALGSKKGVIKILKKSIFLTLVIAFLSVILIYFGADFIATNVLKDTRTAIALKILPLALPFMGISGCLRGYFIARRNVTPNSLGQIFEQSARIALILFLVKRLLNYGIEYALLGIMLGDALAEALGTFILFVIYHFDKKHLDRLIGRPAPDYSIFKKIRHIALPITSGRYLNSLLRTAENILVPINLAKYPLASASALSQFGMIKGMALPILFFPSAILNAVSTLLIPEISEAVAKSRLSPIKYTATRIIKITLLISFIFGAIFWVAGDKIGFIIYKDQSVGHLVKLLAPIVPFMYLDSIADGLLKGLDQQTFCFKTAIVDSTIRIILILVFLPLFGLNGFIGIMYFSNFLTCFCNVKRLIKVSDASLSLIGDILFPSLLAVSIALFANFLISFIPLADIFRVIILTAASVIFYLLLLNKSIKTALFPKIN